MVKNLIHFNSFQDTLQEDFPLSEGSCKPLTINKEMDIVSAEKEKPGLGGPGFAMEHRREVSMTIADSRLTENTNTYFNPAELTMAYDSGFIQIPRILIHDDILRKMPMAYWRIFMVMMSYATHVPRQFNDNGTLIDLLPGQLCISIRQLAEESGGGITRHHVTSCISYLKKLKIIGQDIGHRKNIITITHKATYDLIINCHRTTCQTSIGQASDINNTCNTSSLHSDKNVTSDRQKPNRIATPKIAFDFETRKWQNIAPDDIAGWETAYPAVDIGGELRRMAEWFLSNPSRKKSNYRKFITSWLTKAQDTAKTVPLSQPSQPQKPKDAILKMAQRLEDKYIYEVKFGQLEVSTLTGYTTKFDVTDTQGFERWLQDRKL